ncbi:hypothetical protein BDF20DRAFT_863583 [Mycotypha africana]|uniref:uncharacterized protein n=1 Tax=Mycotypha africana TaxID=64632 RepID=UPI0023010957|nr:uncharacterized protein BDF20DRAFT_863583 [Mycotypha africana]KAI8981847.1 hypothetical protein BDF20DRAFT_863583 [Mycotypha africana]
MDTCLQRDPSRFFWWDLGFKENDDMRRVRAACESEWKSFSTERIASWLAYTVLSFICVYIIFRFQRRLTADRRHRKLVSSDDHSDQWSDDDNTANEKQNSAGNITYHENQESGNKKSDFSNMMHRQRQKLFDEIAKHPEVYTPPPMPPSNSENNNGEQSESWNRYKGSGNGGGNNDSVTLQDDEEMIERQKRLDQLSSERIDYEMYRSDEASNFANKQKPDEVEHGQDNDDNQQWTTVSGASVRKRPKSGRWANITDNKNMYKPLASATPHNEDDSEYEDTVDQQLMDPGHD